MISIVMGLGLVLVGIFFSSWPAIIFGLLCFILGAYTRKSEPVKAAKEEPIKEERKTRHIVLSPEPPETALMPWEMGEFPIDTSFNKRGFLPLPEYGYGGPLEQIFFGFPVKFWRKKNEK